MRSPASGTSSTPRGWSSAEANSDIKIGENTSVLGSTNIWAGSQPGDEVRFYSEGSERGAFSSEGLRFSGWTTQRYTAETNADGWRKAFSYTATANDNHIAYVRVRVMNSDFQGGLLQSPSVGEIEIAISRLSGVTRSKLQRKQIAGYGDIQDFIQVIRVNNTLHEVQIRPQRNTTKYERFTWEVSYIEFEPTKITWDFETDLNTAGSADAGGSHVVVGDGTEFFDTNIEMRKDLDVTGTLTVPDQCLIPGFTVDVFPNKAVKNATEKFNTLISVVTTILLVRAQ